jgi:L-asparaginase
MTPQIWDQIATAVYKNYDRYDGFVITHGTDTMAYTASALSFALQNLGKPVVCTGAQIPGHFLESDARRNFCNAIKVALYNLSGIYIVFGDEIILGCRSSKVSHSKLDAFSSVNVPFLGQVGIDIRFHQPVPSRNQSVPKLSTGFDPYVAVFSLVPGIPGNLLEQFIEQGIHGAVLIAYGTGNIPKDCLSFLKKAEKHQIPVIIRTQCLEGATNMHVYEMGRLALHLKAIQAYDMSLESSITKLMWVLNQKVPYEKIKEWIHINIAGEIHPVRERMLLS